MSINRFVNNGESRRRSKSREWWREKSTKISQLRLAKTQHVRFPLLPAVLPLSPPDILLSHLTGWSSKMRRPADYVPVTTTTSSNHSSSSGSHKPRKSTKAPRSSSSSSTTTTTTTTMEAAPPLPPVPTVEGFAGGTRQPSLAGKISQNPSAATTLPFRPVPPTSVSSRYTPTTFAREPAEEEEDDDEWSETKFLETLKRKEKPVRGVVDGSIRSSHSVTS